MKVCAPTYPSDSVLSFCRQPLTSANVFCILSFIRYVSITIVLFIGSALRGALSRTPLL